MYVILLNKVTEQRTIIYCNKAVKLDNTNAINRIAIMQADISNFNCLIQIVTNLIVADKFVQHVQR
jgi:hypothetical protein